MKNAPRSVTRALLRRSALTYARRGWKVLPGASSAGSRFDCGTVSCPTSNCHPAHDELGVDLLSTSDIMLIDQWWQKWPHSVLLSTGVNFDVLEVPAYLGEITTAYLAERGPRCPTAIAAGGRWMLFVAPGDPLRPELHRQFDIVLHGKGSWVPAPPSPHPTGHVRWEVAPKSLNWTLPNSYPVQHALVEALQVAAPRPAA
ncbi:MAG: bifunctional DNA primase/polymerase [Longispora sp.]|nr:bifunctional DNA primase/polymerase [Longispora sp. (in: high G+C Gram-positive bacteria)]